MSLEILLANFPQYSARKVRRLASQLVYLAGIKSKEAKDIGADLMDYNLMMARQELILNDDVRQDGLPLEVKRSDPWWGEIAPPHTLEEAIDEINEMRADWAKLAKMVGFQEFTDPEVIFKKVEGVFTGTGAVRERIETVCVTPHAEAKRAVDLLCDEGGAFPDLRNKAYGIINGPSFYTDRKRVTHEDGSVSVSTAD